MINESKDKKKKNECLMNERTKKINECLMNERKTK